MGTDKQNLVIANKPQRGRWRPRGELYKRRKDRTRLTAAWRAPMPFGCYVDVYVWKDKAALWASSYEEPPYVANYVSLYHLVRWDGEGWVPIRQKWGEIHLEAGEFGAGVVAHELMHVLFDWMGALAYNLARDDDEDLCYLMQELTAGFWLAYYDEFPQEARDDGKD